jgi:hypothetical protein
MWMWILFADSGTAHLSDYEKAGGSYPNIVPEWRFEYYYDAGHYTYYEGHI